MRTFTSIEIFKFILQTLFDGEPEDPNYNPLPEERPGGFDWGAAGENAEANNLGDEQNRRPHEDQQFKQSFAVLQEDNAKIQD